MSKNGRIALPGVNINDAPRFAYRGTMLDVARHFATADSVKRFIDMIALHGINRMHWHLDRRPRLAHRNQARLPELTKITVAHRFGYGDW